MAEKVISQGDSASQAGASEATQFATSLLTALYEPQSTQLKAFSAGCDAIFKMKQPGFGGVSVELCRHARGTITSAKAELEAGLIGNLRIQVTGHAGIHRENRRAYQHMEIWQPPFLLLRFQQAGMVSPDGVKVLDIKS